DIEFSLFAKGNSIASVIANEFTEATYDLYLSALVELGLVLLIVSALMSALARLLIKRTMSGKPPSPLFSTWMAHWRRLPGSLSPRRGMQASAWAGHDPDFRPSPLQRRHKRSDREMTRMLTESFILTVAPLFLIIGYLFFKGVGALDWNFF